jgi:CDP-paratose 2-epimerase
MSATYFITGGGGFLGCNLASTLLEKGERVVVYDNLSRVGSEENLEWLRSRGNVEFIHASTLEADTLGAALDASRPNTIFHLAGQVAMTTSLRDPRGDFRTNVEGTINLLEAVRRYSPDSGVVYSSSNKVYGALTGVRLVELSTRYDAPDFPDGIDEAQSLDFRTPYGCSKGAADQYVLEYARTYGLKAAVFRHSTIYGGRQHSTYDQGWVGWFCGEALRQKVQPETPPFTISGDGKQVRDLLYVDDAVNCYLTAAAQLDRVAGQAFNIGGGMENSCSLLELFAMLEDLLDAKLRFERLGWRHEDQRFFVADLNKFRTATSWRPGVGREKGVSLTLDWVRSHARP